MVVGSEASPAGGRPNLERYLNDAQRTDVPTAMATTGDSTTRAGQKDHFLRLLVGAVSVLGGHQRSLGRRLASPPTEATAIPPTPRVTGPTKGGRCIGITLMASERSQATAIDPPHSTPPTRQPTPPKTVARGQRSARRGRPGLRRLAMGPWLTASTWRWFRRPLGPQPRTAQRDRRRSERTIAALPRAPRRTWCTNPGGGPARMRLRSRLPPQLERDYEPPCQGHCVASRGAVAPGALSWGDPGVS